MIELIFSFVDEERVYGAIFGLFTLIVTIPLAVGCYWLLLRLMDWALGVNFREEFGKFTPAARGDYFGKRNIGVAIIVGAIFLRFF